MAHDFAQPPNAQPPDAQPANVQVARTVQKGLSGALLLSWLWLNGPTLQWLGQSLLEQSKFNQLFLAAVAVLLVVQAIRTDWFQTTATQTSLQTKITTKPQLLPVVLLLGSAVAALGARWFLDFEQVPAVLFLLGSYGLAGLFLAPELWRKGLSAAAAIAVVVPFWMQFTSGLGFPARILTAQAVEALLKTWHVAALSSEDIIVLDTGIAQVDLPCSGFKSLWMGTVLLLGMTWLEKRQVGLKWLLVCGANLGLLVVANVARVLTLVLLIYVLRQPALADVVHMPLGIVTFVMVSLIAWGLLRWVPQVKDQVKDQVSNSQDSRSVTIRETQSRKNQQAQTTRLLAGLVAVLLTLSLIPRPVITAPSLPSLGQLNWPADMQVESMPLTEPEQTFFVTYPGVVADKQRFNFDLASSALDSSTADAGISGSMILVASPTWQAHHSPELCYIGNGFRINQMRQQQLTSTVLGRWLWLDQNQTGYAATYWFQSPHHTTDSYLTRLWADLTRQEQSWTMVSILFDQPYAPEAPEMQAFLNQVQMTLDHAS
jgi:exosortase O